MNKNKQRMTSKRSPKQNRRIFGQWLFFGAIAIFGVLSIRFSYIAIGKHVAGVNLAAATKKLYTVDQTVTAKRGTIYSANGEAIAEDTSTYTIYAIMSKNQKDAAGHDIYVKSNPQAAKVLAKYLPISTKKALATLKKGRGKFQIEFGTAGKNISLTTKKKIEAQNVSGLHFIQSEARLYPNGTFASHLIGLTSSKNVKGTERTSLVGSMGIELAYNKQLSGTDGHKTVTKSGYQGTTDSVKKVKNGDNIYTTLDSKLQTLMETKLSEVATKVHPKTMTATLMNAKTGAILATSQRPTFNSQTKVGLSKMWRNLLVEDTFEPGSTMKVFTMAAAINSGNYNPNVTVPTGEYKIGGKTVPDWNTSGWGNITYAKGFALSSNVAMAHLEQTMGAKTWLKYIKRFGLRSSTNSGLANEQTGTVQFTYPIEQADTSFGQGIQVSAMQMLRGFTAIANNGKMLQPYYVSKITNPNTKKTVYKGQSKVVSQPVTSKTAAAVLKHMQDVVYKSYGTGSAFKINGYRIAAKTGTAQVSNGSTYETGDNSYLYSVVGMAPAKNPKYILYITMKQPTLNGTSASEDMAEIFKPVMQRALDEQKASESKTTTVKMTDLTGQATKQATVSAKKDGVTPIVIGKGAHIVKQSVSAGTVLTSKQRVILITNGQMYMPNLTGWSASEVADFAELTGMKLATNGTGYVSAQSVSAGNPIEAKEALTVSLK
ncbi:penicillin-binding transpeptidase domain-containing protein [Lactiplantibacillus sp. WILCCON 0030]|uniref:Penicillin-binding transpeptidase domain-containing protein n=1 Tax=Lactiplantibacillus brownii TaxID=3069269 RepID=A0ABU1A9S9_9LACO|nr:penicillin-binding transpeptidase domain-containing protein [Lactiplantibacillus brownii]MDQ7937633.1 penicillin-binding transpeptidase domain-containing protein [Lactiplantibacillus brownii]